MTQAVQVADVSVEAPPPARAGWVHLPFPVLLVLTMQTAFLIACLTQKQAIRQMSLAGKAVFVLSNYLGTVAWFQVIGLALGRWTILLRIANLLSVWLIAVLLGWHAFNGVPLDWLTITSNIGQLTAVQDSMNIIAARSSKWALIGFGALTLVLVGLAIGTTWLSQRRPVRWPRCLLIGSAGLLVGIACIPVDRQHDLVYLLRTAAAEWISGVDTPSGYPYVHRVADSNLGRPLPTTQPSVFVVMVESFNARFVGQKNEAGQEYTPFLNSLVSQGLYVERFYGNSMQTPRGQEATWLSIPPSFSRKIAEIKPPVRLRSLPAILRDHGYRTFFFQGHKEFDFDNTHQFTQRIGFQTTESIGQWADGREDEKPHMWSYWGISDDRLYLHAFESIDRVTGPATSQPDGSVSAGPPCFVTFATITSHMMWEDTPAELRMLYPDPGEKEYFKKFANSIRLTDCYLETFFAELKKRPQFANSVVIITGDHSYPAGDHLDADGAPNFQNELGFYEENFRVPFLMLWPGHLAPRRESTIAYSQLDIAPTVMDALGLRADNHFTGRSMLAPTTEQRPIPMHQTYGGVYLVVVKHPLKYVVNRISHDEWLFDLAADPHEDHNLVRSYRGRSELDELKREAYKLQQNQRLIEANRIWPG